MIRKKSILSYAFTVFMTMTLFAFPQMAFATETPSKDNTDGGSVSLHLVHHQAQSLKLELDTENLAFQDVTLTCIDPVTGEPLCISLLAEPGSSAYTLYDLEVPEDIDGTLKISMITQPGYALNTSDISFTINGQAYTDGATVVIDTPTASVGSVIPCLQMTPPSTPQTPDTTTPGTAVQPDTPTADVPAVPETPTADVPVPEAPTAPQTPPAETPAVPPAPAVDTQPVPAAPPSVTSPAAVIPESPEILTTTVITAPAAAQDSIQSPITEAVPEETIPETAAPPKTETAVPDSTVSSPVHETIASAQSGETLADHAAVQADAEKVTAPHRISSAMMKRIDLTIASSLLVILAAILIRLLFLFRRERKRRSFRRSGY